MAGLKINKKVVKDIKKDSKVVNDVSKEEKEVANTLSDTYSDDLDDVDAQCDTVDGLSDDGDGGGVKKQGNKKVLKVLLIGGGVLILLSLGGVMLLSKVGVSDEDMLPDTEGIGVEEDISKEEELPVEDDVVEEEPKEDIDKPQLEAKVVYENALLGVALKYPSNWYVEERADVLLNMVQSTNNSGAIDLLTTEVKLAGVVMDFSARDELNTTISMGISPLVITGDTKVSDIKSLSDVLNVGTATQIDEQIKKNVGANGGNLLNHTPSIVKQIGNYNVIQSVYQFEKNGISMDVVQMLIPYGVNNVVLTATSKVGTNPINREEVLIGMVGSLGKIGDVKLDEIKEDIPVDDTTVNKDVDNVDSSSEGVKEEVKEEVKEDGA